MTINDPKPSVHVRLPAALVAEVHRRSEAEGVSVNMLLATLIAGAMQFKLPKETRAKPPPAKINRRIAPRNVDARTKELDE
jgi:hypothetical protein